MAKRPRPARLPQLRWRNGRAWIMLVASLAFLCSGFALPDRMVRTHVEHAIDVIYEVGELKTLEERDMLTEGG